MQIRTAAVPAALALGLAAILWPMPVGAGTFHDLDAIDRAVAGFTGHGSGEPGGAQAGIDRRLKLAPCLAPLQVEYFGVRRDAVRVACPGRSGWRVFVPLRDGQAAHTAPAVLRKDTVRVEASGAGFRVARPGEALEDGREGETIHVRLDDGTRQGRVISASVLGAGRVAAARH